MYLLLFGGVFMEVVFPEIKHDLSTNGPSSLFTMGHFLHFCEKRRESGYGGSKLKIILFNCYSLKGKTAIIVYHFCIKWKKSAMRLKTKLKLIKKGGVLRF